MVARQLMRAIAEYAGIAIAFVLVVKTPIALLWMAVGDSIHRK